MKSRLLLALVGIVGTACCSTTARAGGPNEPPASARPTSQNASFETVGGHQQLFAPAYAAWFGPIRHPPRYARATLEVLALVAIGTAYYWVDPLADGRDSESVNIAERFTLRTFRFDANLNSTNHLLHPLAGAFVHQAVRVNGLSIPIALAYGAAQSLFWEVALEWRERSSINDLVYTTIGGLAFGEVLYRASDYFSSAPKGGPAQRIAAWSLGFPRRVHMAVDREREPAVQLGLDNLGFSAAYGHDFHASYEVAALTNDVKADGLLHRLRLDTKLVAMPGFLRPGTFAKSFDEGNFTEMRLRMGFSNKGFDETDLQLRATLFGYYSQRLTRTAHEGRAVNGLAGMAGIGPALRFQSSQWLGRPDQLSTVHLPGAHLDLWMTGGGVFAHVGGEAYVDLASVLSLAYPAFVARYTANGTKSVLERRGYAYSVGAWGRVHGAVGFGPLTLTASAAFGHYGSVQGFDRYQEQVTRDIIGFEQVLEVETEAQVRLGPLQLGAGARERQRRSSLAEVVARRWDRDFHVSLGLRF